MCLLPSSFSVGVYNKPQEPRGLDLQKGRDKTKPGLAYTCTYGYIKHICGEGGSKGSHKKCHLIALRVKKRYNPFSSSLVLFPKDDVKLWRLTLSSLRNPTKIRLFISSFVPNLAEIDYYLRKVLVLNLYSAVNIVTSCANLPLQLNYSDKTNHGS